MRITLIATFALFLLSFFINPIFSIDTNSGSVDSDSSIQIDYLPVTWAPNPQANRYEISIASDAQMKNMIPYQGNDKIIISKRDDGTFSYNPPQAEQPEQPTAYFLSLDAGLYYFQIKAYFNEQLIQRYRVFHLTFGSDGEGEFDEYGRPIFKEVEIDSQVNNNVDDYYNIYQDQVTKRKYIPLNTSIRPKNTDNRYDEGQSTFVKVDQGEWVEVPGIFNQSFGDVLVFEEGEHCINHKLWVLSTKQYEQKHVRVYADGTAPTISLAFDATKYVQIGDIAYGNKNVTFTLEAQDDTGGSGIQKILYTFGDGELHEYTGQPVPVPRTGDLDILFWAMDNVGNLSERMFRHIKVVDPESPAHAELKPEIVGLRALASNIFQDMENTNVYFTSVDNRLFVDARSRYAEIVSQIFELYDEEGVFQYKGNVDAYHPIVFHDPGVYTLVIEVRDSLGLPSQAQYIVNVE
jgi:hypothetical protein